MQLGNGRWESTQFNSRLQPTQIALGTTQNGTDQLKLNYDYGTTANNGNVQSQTITVPGMSYPLIQTYTYDTLNRLKSAEEKSNGSTTWKQTFLYYRYGNRNFDTANTTTLGSCPQAQCNPTVSATNNRFTSVRDTRTIFPATSSPTPRGEPSPSTRRTSRPSSRTATTPPSVSITTTATASASKKQLQPKP